MTDHDTDATIRTTVGNFVLGRGTTPGYVPEARTPRIRIMAYKERGLQNHDTKVSKNVILDMNMFIKIVITDMMTDIHMWGEKHAVHITFKIQLVRCIINYKI